MLEGSFVNGAHIHLMIILKAPPPQPRGLAVLLGRSGSGASQARLQDWTQVRGAGIGPLSLH